MSDYFSIQFLIYLGRWILSAFVMMLPLWCLVKFNCCKGKYQEYIHLLIIQIVGAIIFFHLDKLIFAS
jgi:hypothetical protein